MSDAPREEEIYQALEPGSSYRSGLTNPVAEIPMRFKGAMGGGAVGNEDYPDHEPRASVPYKHYKDLEDIDPKLHEAVTHVADEIHVPRTDLASLVYANSGYDANARNGMRTGYMGLTPDDARQLDPEGHLDINDPVDNLFMGAMKYKRISNRFGMGTPNAFAAYYGGGDRIQTLLGNDPDEHRRMAPDGTFEFLNKVLGRGEGSGGGAPAVDAAGSGGDEGGVAGMAASAQAAQQPERFVPQQGAVPPMYPGGPVPPPPNQPAQYAPGTQSAAGTVDTLAAHGDMPPPSQPAPVPAAQPAIRPAPVTSTGPVPSSDSLAGVAPMYPSVPTSPPPPVGPPAGPEPISQAIGNFFAPAPGAQQPFTRAPGAPPGYTPNRVIGSGPQIEPISPGQGAPGAEQLGDRADYPMAPPQRQEYQPPFTPAPPPLDDTGWQRPVPPAAPVDDTNWQRPAPTPPAPDLEPQIARALAQGALPTTPPAPPPPAARRPAAPTTPAPSTDNMAADLNRQELARIQGGQPDVPPTTPTVALARTPAPVATTGSGAPATPTPTTAPGAGGVGEAPAATLPAGAPKALAPPGSEPTATAAPPIDRLQGNGGAMTPTSAVRAGAGGPGEVLTHIARNGPRGMSIGDGWDHFQDLLERAMIMKGDVAGLQHAQEYVFRMKHKGAMENLMQAIGSMDDPETAVRFLAKSHAFVTDGTVIGFQVLNNQIYGQKYDEQTHDKIGKPFSVTEQGLRQLAIAHSDPSKFNAALNTERQTNETGRHNRKTEQHADAQLKQTGEISERSFKEKQYEYDMTRLRLEEQHKERQETIKSEGAARREAAAELAKQRAADKAEADAQREADRKARADVAEENRKAAAELRAQQREDAAAAAREASDRAKAEKAAELKAGHAKAVSEEVGDLYGTDTQPGMLRDPKDDKKSAFKPADIARASQLHMGIRAYNEDIAPNVAATYVKNLIEGKYKIDEYEDDPGYAHVLDDQGKSLARVPRSVWRAYLPSPKAPTGTRPNPRPQQR